MAIILRLRAKRAIARLTCARRNRRQSQRKHKPEKNRKDALRKKRVLRKSAKKVAKDFASGCGVRASNTAIITVSFRRCEADFAFGTVSSAENYTRAE